MAKVDPPREILIGGRWRASHSREQIAAENPSTGTIEGSIAAGEASDVDEAVHAAQDARAGAWGAMSALERGRVLAAIGRAVIEHGERLAQTESRDVGKPISQARADVVALARYLEFYAGAADKLHGETLPYLNGYTVYTLREPCGVTGHIIPWNYPLQIIGRSVIAALAMGNATVLKPAEDASLSALAFAALAENAGLPPGALNIVTGLGRTAGAALAAHSGVDHISFTGSFEVGAAIQAAASRNAVAVTLELGGKSPQLVFADADLDKALPILLMAGIQNAGQTCSAGSRILVQRSVYDTVVQRLAERISALRSAPANADREIGPVISAKQRQRVEHYIDLGRRDLDLRAQGQIASDAPSGGHYVSAALFANVPAHHALAQEEIFGPVLIATPFDTEEEAIQLANGTPYGLVAGVWTRDGARQMRLAKSLRAGQVFINNYGAGGGVELPFGGHRRSGHGREKGMEALYSFSTLKTVAAHHE